ncbi:MAG TPA: molybdenum cofactor guanylyltransferase [Gemmatimonadaceae bacterium]
MPAAGVILVGGRASRFGGRPKGLERIGGRPIVDRVLEALRSVTDDVVLAGGGEELARVLGVPAVADEEAGLGPLGGIAGALAATGKDALVVAWDMPWVTAAALRPLLEAPDDGAGAAWRAGGEIEPLCALYRQRALPSIRAMLGAGERRARAAAEALGLMLLDASALDARTFASINTPGDLAVAEDFFHGHRAAP